MNVYQTPFQKTPPGVTDAQLRDVSARPRPVDVALSFVKIEIGAAGEQADAGHGEPDGEDAVAVQGVDVRVVFDCARYSVASRGAS